MHFLNDENDKALKKKFTKLDQTSSNRFPPDSLSLSLSHFPSNETPREGRVRGSDEGGEGGGGGG